MVIKKGCTNVRSLLVKIIALPTLLILAMNLSDNVTYSEMWQPAPINASRLYLRVGMEYSILKKGTLWTSVALDVVTAVVIIWFLSYLFNGAAVTLGAAIVLSLIIGALEFILHRYLINSGKTIKDPNNPIEA